MFSSRFFDAVPSVSHAAEKFVMSLFGGQSRRKALVADDNVFDRRRISALLEGMDWDVVEAEDGGPAVQLALSERPDLILLGNNLQLLSGETVVAILRADDKTRKVPIIIVSSNDKLSDVERCLEEGADDYVVKPFDPHRLSAKIEKLIARE